MPEATTQHKEHERADRDQRDVGLARTDPVAGKSREAQEPEGPVFRFSNRSMTSVK